MKSYHGNSNEPFINLFKGTLMPDANPQNFITIIKPPPRAGAVACGRRWYLHNIYYIIYYTAYYIIHVCRYLFFFFALFLLLLLLSRHVFGNGRDGCTARIVRLRISRGDLRGNGLFRRDVFFRRTRCTRRRVRLRAACCVRFSVGFPRRKTKPKRHAATRFSTRAPRGPSVFYVSI